MNIRTTVAVLLLVLMVGFTAGCSTRSRSVPVNVSDLYLKPFDNNTSEPGLGDILTEDATQEFLSSGQVNLVDRSKADAVLIGVIERYKHIPLIFNDQDIVQQYKVRIEISIALKDPETGEVLWTHPDVRRETTYSDVQPPIETELDAQRRVSDMLARDVVTSTVEGWPYMDDLS
jgi:hypothetical protein